MKYFNHFKGVLVSLSYQLAGEFWSSIIVWPRDSNSNSFEFAKWISEIYLCYDEFYPDFDEKNPPDFPFAKNEENFRNAVRDIFLEIQKY